MWAMCEVFLWFRIAITVTIKSDVYKNNFFPKTGRDWNNLDESTVSAKSIEDWKNKNNKDR